MSEINEVSQPPAGSPQPSDRRLRRERFGRMLAEMRHPSRAPLATLTINSFTLGMTLLGIVASVHSSVFGQDDGHWLGYLRKPRQETVLLRDLLGTGSPVHAQKNESGGSSGSGGDDKLYVFALDVSGSLDGELHAGEVDLFREKYMRQNPRWDPSSAIPCWPKTNEEVRRWHLARSEVCCMLSRVPKNAFVGLWEFGTSASYLSESPYIQFSERENFQVPDRTTLIAALSGLVVDGDVKSPGKQSSSKFNYTDFRALLDALNDTYLVEPVKEWREIHFVIVSDFLQDTGRGELLEEYSSRLIQERFKELSRRGVMFHLSSFHEGLQEVNSVIGLARESIEWYNIRVEAVENPATNPEFSYFYSFSESLANIRFHYEAGTEKVQPVVVGLDGWGDTQVNLVVALMKDAYAKQHDDLVLQVASVTNQEECPETLEEGAGLEDRPDILRVNDRAEKKLSRADDRLCLMPLNVPQVGGGEYRLTMSGVGGRQGDLGGEGERATSMIEIEFARFLPRWAMWAFRIGLTCVIASIGFLSWWVCSALRRSRSDGGPRRRFVLVDTRAFR